MAKQTVASAWNDYETHTRSMGCTESTVAAYRTATRELIRLYGHKNIDNLTGTHVAEFMLAAARTRSASSMVTTHNIATGFFNYCTNTGKIRFGRNPMYGRRPPKVPETDKLRIPFHRFPELLELAGQRSPRDRALVAVGLYTLLRDQDMAALRIRDVDLAAGRIHAVVQKSKREDSVPIPLDLDVELRPYLTWYTNHVGALRPDMYLLPATEHVRWRDPATGRYAGTRLNTTLLPFTPVGKTARLIKPLVAEMGYPSAREGAHTLRRSGARAIYDWLVAQGRADALRVVQTSMHHKNQQQTQEYIGLKEDRATRDELLRGVSIFGFDQITTIGDHTRELSDDGYKADHRASV